MYIMTTAQCLFVQIPKIFKLYWYTVFYSFYSLLFVCFSWKPFQVVHWLMSSSRRCWMEQSIIITCRIFFSACRNVTGHTLIKWSRTQPGSFAGAFNHELDIWECEQFGVCVCVFSCKLRGRKWRESCREGCLPTRCYNEQCSVREQEDSTLPEALWFPGNNSCIPPLPPEL